MKFTISMRRGAIVAAAGLAFSAWSGTAVAASPPLVGPAPTYADLADLADPAELVLRVKVSRQSVVEPDRAPGLAAGMVRLYLVAKPEEALSGQRPAVKAVKYLVDVPLSANGKVPRLAGKRQIVFARLVSGRPDELQLVAPDAQIVADPALVARLAPVLTELGDPGAPPRVSGIRDILSVPGNLAGESETQLFLKSQRDGPVLVSVVRRPGQSPIWSVSWSELVDQAGRPPAPDTLAWYRLACSLPERLPPRANIGSSDADRTRAMRDYALIRQELGACNRTRK